jgi:predicted peroxiredoxin
MSRILYIQTSGTDTPERLYAPFVLGSMAAAMGIEASIFFMIKGVTVMKTGEAEKVKIGPFPNLKHMLDKALVDGVKCYVCDRASSCSVCRKGTSLRRQGLRERPRPMISRSIRMR